MKLGRVFSMHPFLYRRLSEALLLELATGFYPEGARFLSLREIAKRYAVSKPTAAMAHHELLKHELVQMSDRSGCYVCRGAREKALLLLRHGPGLAAPLPRSWKAKKQRLVGRPLEMSKILIVYMTHAFGHLPLTGTGHLPTQLRSAIGCSEAARRRGVELEYALHDGSAKRHEVVVRALESDGISGLLVIELAALKGSLDRLVRLAVGRGISVVKTGSETQSANIIHVDFNNVAAGYEAVALLAKAGARKVTILQPGSGEACYSLRCEGARRAAADFGLEANLMVSHFAENQYPLSVPRARNDFPEAFLCLGHELAVAVDRVARRKRLKAGVDFSILTFSSIHDLGRSQTDIMKMDFNQRGAAAMDVLLDTLEGKDVHRSTFIPIPYTPASLGATIIHSKP